MTDAMFGATSAAFGQWSMLEPYAVSLARSGYAGRKIMFTQNLPADTTRKLAGLGFELIEFAEKIKSYEHFWYLRANLVRQYLVENPTRYAMILDCRDQVFQGNPSEWLETRLAPAKLVACSEHVPISFGWPNEKWITEALGRQEWLDSYPVLCGGTFGGESEAFVQLLNAFCDILQHEKATDQALLNYFCRLSPFKEITKIPTMAEGFTCTCCQIAGRPAQLERSRPYLTDEEPAFRNGLVYPKGSAVPFCIVHQYDTNPAWDAVIRNRYRL
jgi:hypothetical protein